MSESIPNKRLSDKVEDFVFGVLPQSDLRSINTTLQSLAPEQISPNLSHGQGKCNCQTCGANWFDVVYSNSDGSRQEPAISALIAGTKLGNGALTCALECRLLREFDPTLPTDAFYKLEVYGSRSNTDLCLLAGQLSLLRSQLIDD